MILALVLILIVNCLPTVLLAETVLENFEQYHENTFPTKWRARNNDAQKIYLVENEAGNHFLRARADRQGIQIALEHAIDPTRQPHLRWHWRVHKFPRGADERVGDKHDAAAQVYVVFDNSYFPRVLKYIWSETLPAGSHFKHPLYPRGYVIVLRSGPIEPGKWHAEEVNYHQDYKRLFGSEPGMVQGIAVLTASDSTGTQASADYDDFVAR